jgi:hypothetical protein
MFLFRHHESTQPHGTSIIMPASGGSKPVGVPEPGTLPLMIAGAVLLVIWQGIRAWRNRPRVVSFVDHAGDT